MLHLKVNKIMIQDFLKQNGSQDDNTIPSFLFFLALKKIIPGIIIIINHNCFYL